MEDEIVWDTNNEGVDWGEEFRKGETQVAKENLGRHHKSRDGSLTKENLINYMLKS